MQSFGMAASGRQPVCGEGVADSYLVARADVLKAAHDGARGSHDAMGA
jgi:hypothetical protein